MSAMLVVITRHLFAAHGDIQFMTAHSAAFGLRFGVLACEKQRAQEAARAFPVRLHLTKNLYIVDMSTAYQRILLMICAGAAVTYDVLEVDSDATLHVRCSSDWHIDPMLAAS